MPAGGSEAAAPSRRDVLTKAAVGAAAAWTAPTILSVRAAAAATSGGGSGLFDYTGGNQAVGLQAPHTRLAGVNGLAYTSGTTLPADLATFDIVVLCAQTTLFSTGDLALLASVLTAGRTLLYETDGNIYSTAMAPVFNQVTAAVGASITDLDKDWEDSPQCRVTTDVASDPLTAGFTQIGYGLTSELAFTGSARRLFSGQSGQVVAVAQDIGAGRFVGIADVNVVSDFAEVQGCALAENDTFRQNLV